MSNNIDSNILLYEHFTTFICELLNLKTPFIYYINYNDNDITLYDKGLNIISYDKRDVGKQVNNIMFIPKENTLYINYIFSDKIVKTLVLISKRLRFMYQLREVSMFDKKDFANEDIDTLRIWKHEFTPSTRQLNERYNNQVSPAEMDRKAFSYVIMKTIFNRTIDYHVMSESKNNIQAYNKSIDNVLKKFPLIQINAISKKYELKLRKCKKNA